MDESLKCRGKFWTPVKDGRKNSGRENIVFFFGCVEVFLKPICKDLKNIQLQIENTARKTHSFIVDQTNRPFERVVWNEKSTATIGAKKSAQSTNQLGDVIFDPWTQT